MKARSAAIQGVLAVVGLVAAYVTWQRPKESITTDTVVLLDATKQSLEKVHYQDGTRFLDLVRRVEAEPVIWLTTGYLPGKTPVYDAGIASLTLDGGADGGTDGGADGGAAAVVVNVKPPEPPPTREMRGNERADTVYGKFAPLEVARVLGVLAPEKLTELGLGDTERSLEVTVAGTTHQFKVSKPLTGIIGTYLLEVKSGKVALLQGSLVSELDPGAQILVDRRLHTFKPTDFDHFTVTAGGKEAAFVWTGAETGQNTKVARAATPDQAEDLVKNWHEKLWSRVIVTEVLGKGELPKLGEPKVELRVDYLARGAKKGFLEIGFDTSAATWARSENTAGWVAVHQAADELVIEAKKNVVE